MIAQIKTKDTTAPSVVELVADTDADVAFLPTHYAAGSTCIIVASSSVYMLNNNKEWKQL